MPIPALLYRYRTLFHRNQNPIQKVEEIETVPSILLLDLSNELLLAIVEYSADGLPRHRRRDLVVLTTVCKRLNTMAIELLHSELCTSLYGLRKLGYLYAQEPELGEKVKSLEMFYEKLQKSKKKRPSKQKGNLGLLYERLRKRKKETPTSPQQRLDMQLSLSTKAQDNCRDAMRTYGLSADNQDLLLLRLAGHDRTAILTMALMLMPNLRALLLGNMGPSIAIFSTFYLSWQQQSPHLSSAENAHPYYDEAFAQLAGRLVTLELPASLKIIANLSMFGRLETLSSGCEKLRTGSGTEAHLALPHSLRNLKVTIGQQRLGLLQSLAERKWSGVLGKLETLELDVDGSDDSGFFNDKDGVEQLECCVRRLGELGVVTTYRWC
jgi:hypothetical protein